MALELWHIGVAFGFIIAIWVLFEWWDNKTEEEFWDKVLGENDGVKQTKR